MEEIKNPTNDLYQILKARKEYLKKLIHNFETMDLLTEKGKYTIISGLNYEISHVQHKIDDLMW